MQEIQASEEMQKFFENLLEIKNYVKQKAQELNDPILQEIYQKLHHVIKSTEENE